VPDRAQTARYRIQGGAELCAHCFSHGHGAPWRMARSDNPLGRRRENRVVACLPCGEVLGVYIEGGRVPEYDHDCE
jgi:hypothetical protein